MSLVSKQLWYSALWSVKLSDLHHIVFSTFYASPNPKQLVSQAKDWAVMLQTEYSLANSHQSLSASNFIILCFIILWFCVPGLYDCPKKVFVESKMLQSIMKFDVLEDWWLFASKYSICITLLVWLFIVYITRHNPQSFRCTADNCDCENRLQSTVVENYLQFHFPLHHDYAYC